MMKKSKDNKRLLNKIKAKLFLTTFGGYAGILLTLFAFAFALGKEFNFVVILIAYSISRFVYPTTWHADSTKTCYWVTIASFMCATMACLPIRLTLFSGVLVGNLISFALYKAQILVESRKPSVDVYLLTEDELRAYGRSLGLKENIIDTMVLRIVYNYKWVEIQRERNYTKDGIRYHKEQIEKKLKMKI